MANKKYKAVTLIELLVVISIISILTAVSTVSLQSSKTSAKLKTAQREIASQIKLAQNYALQGRAQNGVTPCGYGFRFDSADVNKQKYEIFYNLPTITSGDCSVKNSNANFLQYVSGSIDPNDDSVPAEIQALNNGVIIFSPDLITDPTGTEIYFTVPHGNIYDNAGNPYTGPTQFIFDLGGAKKIITINSGGTVTEN